MKVFHKVIFVAAGVLLSNLTGLLINILQAGSRRPDGRTMAQILGKDPRQATWEDVERLSRRDTMQLFYAAEVPEFQEMKGEYQARVLSGGLLGRPTALFTHHVFPSGRPILKASWEGKAFNPEGRNRGWGYNIFNVRRPDGTTQTLRRRRMNNWVGPTTIGKDGRDAYHLDYGPYNDDVVHSMHDEVRRVNERLYICAGYMSLGGGPLNPGPFVLIGPPREWVGPDE